MLSKRVIPCLDVADGRVVKGVNFVSLKDAGDPVEQASLYDAAGADEICFLDISASPEGRSTMVDIVAETAEKLFTPLTVGGGVRTEDDCTRLLFAGADKVAMNTAAIENPALIEAAAKRFGAQAIVVCVDAKREGDGYAVYSHGGRNRVLPDAIEWCKKVAELGAGEIMLTSMDRDGTGQGYDTELLSRVSSAVGISVIASGGVGELEHLAQGLEAGAQAVLAASIFHYGKYSIGEAKSYLADRGIAIRPAPEAP